MSRPAPTVIFAENDSKSQLVEEVVYADAIYAVFYEDSPINLKLTKFLVENPIPRYKKTSFSNPAYALKLRDRLNAQFKTDKFTVRVLTFGEILE